jgi:superoxide dismutase, Fe-Mn family
MIYSLESNQDRYPFFLPDLPFDKTKFTPHFSPETFDYHHGKHHKAYVDNLNNLLKDKTELHNKSLEEIIILSAKNKDLGGIFNNAAQIWNHNFFWHSITSKDGGGKPGAKILEHITKDFGGFENFCTKFKETAVTQFGSGWAWLVLNNGKLELVKTPNAATPITDGLQPILTCDVWEHAYYIDYRNKRPDYVDTYIHHMINWKFAEQNLHKVQ